MILCNDSMSIVSRCNHVLAIDPGNTQSGIVFVEFASYKPLYVAKLSNAHVLSEVIPRAGTNMCIERVVSYGMNAGMTLFDTCIWIGRFYQQYLSKSKTEPILIPRKHVKLNLCGQTNAKDKNIVAALVERFAPNTPNNGKGTKKEPGWFYGFSADMWQAYALAVTYIDYKEGLYVPNNGSISS